MYQQQNSNYPQQSAQYVKAPGKPVGFAACGIPTGLPGAIHTERYGNYHPSLPGMEEYCPPEVPLEFNNSSQSLTVTLDRVLANPSRRDLRFLTHDQRNTLLQWEEDQGLGVGACLNIYPSGEKTGGCYSRGNKRAPGHTRSS